MLCDEQIECHHRDGISHMTAVGDKHGHNVHHIISAMHRAHARKPSPIMMYAQIATGSERCSDGGGMSHVAHKTQPSAGGHEENCIWWLPILLFGKRLQGDSRRRVVNKPHFSARVHSL